MTELALSIRGLQKTYDNGVVALRGIDLDVAAGDFFALLGPNGAGKSTTIGIITSLVRPTAGSVKVFGHDLGTARGEAGNHRTVTGQCGGIAIGMFNDDWRHGRFKAVALRGVAGIES